VSTSSNRLRFVAGAAALAVAFASLWPVQAVTVRLAREGGLLWASPAGPGTACKLTWTHTVSRRPITETYVVVKDGRLRLAEMVFDHEGPNLPSEPEEGSTWRLERDRVTVFYNREPMAQLNLGVPPLGQRLQVGAREWDMLAGVGPDRLVRVAVEREPWLFIIATEVWQWRNTRSRS
jgi:hypothetical protein